MQNLFNLSDYNYPVASCTNHS